MHDALMTVHSKHHNPTPHLASNVVLRPRGSIENSRHLLQFGTYMNLRLVWLYSLAGKSRLNRTLGTLEVHEILSGEVRKMPSCLIPPPWTCWSRISVKESKIGQTSH